MRIFSKHRGVKGFVTVIQSCCKVCVYDYRKSKEKDENINEFVDYHIDPLFNDITLFNRKLREYLEFYNTKRVHHAFNNH